MVQVGNRTEMNKNKITGVAFIMIYFNFLASSAVCRSAMLNCCQNAHAYDDNKKS